MDLTTFQGRAGDRNTRGWEGATQVSRELARRLGLEATVVGAPAEPLAAAWDVELEAASDGFRSLAERYISMFEAGRIPITAINRCAAAIATLPIVARYRPDAVVIWFDGHADLNVPSNTATGYLGGIAFSAALGLWDSGFGSGVIPDNAVLVGARDLDPAEVEVVDQGIVRLIGVDDLGELSAVIAGRPVYIHIDCDVLEPGQVPTEYAVPGGLTLESLKRAMADLAGSELVGLEIGECQAGVGDEAAVAELVSALMPVLRPH